MHKIAFELGGFTITWFGILVATGLLIGLHTAARRAAREGISPEVVWDLGFWIFLGAIAGARSLYVVSYWKESFAGRPIWEVFMIQRGGIVFYGGLIGASLAVIGYTRFRRLPLWKIADVLAPSIALGYAIGRWGCLMNGCCYGRFCDLPWAIRFPPEHETAGLPVHPTQIYESLLNFGLFAFLAWRHRRKEFDGETFALYLIGYSLLRSGVEFFRGDYPAYVARFITPAHWVSAAILVSGLVLFSVLSRLNRRRGPPAAQTS